VRAVPRLCEFYPGICLTTEEKIRKNLNQGKINLSQGKKNLSHGKINLSNDKKNLSQGKKNFSQGKKNLSQGQKNLSQCKKNLSQGKKTLIRVQYTYYPNTHTNTHIYFLTNEKNIQNFDQKPETEGNTLCYQALN
jgi:hypothetical protein